MTDAPSLPTYKKVLFGLFVFVGLPVLLLALLEGGASILLFAREYADARRSPVVSRAHVAHDTLLGWANKSSVASPDAYGKGVGFHTNAQGFRIARPLADADTSLPQVACYGDSYTLGIGVADDETWCALLERTYPGVRTINAGQESYGLDQSFLQYRRDRERVRPRVLIFAIVDVSFERSTARVFQGRVKPVVAMGASGLAVQNVPVPAETAKPMQEYLASRTWNDLRLVQLARRVPSLDGTLEPTRQVDEDWPLFERIMTELDSLSRAADTQPALLYLPTRRDLSTRLDARREKMANFARQRHIRFIDLTPQLRALRKDSTDLAFISQTFSGTAPGTTGQYSRLGHAWVARTLTDALAADSLLRAAPLADHKAGGRNP